MDLFEAIKKRHSYRGQFQPTPVPRADLEKIVAAGIAAPSAMNEQIATFVIIDDPEVLKQIADVVARPVCQTAPAMIAVVGDPRPIFHGISFCLEDCSAAVENMLLSITALGYASVWLDGVLRTGDAGAKINAILGVPEGQSVEVLLPVGVPVVEETQKEKKPFTQRALYNRF
jgi:nitroreductase